MYDINSKLMGNNKNNFKPCPFCGEKEIYVEEIKNAFISFFVYCNSCASQTDYFPSITSAVSAWERRV